MAAVERVSKSGHNDHFNYDFVTEADITSAVRAEMARRQLMIVPSAVDAKVEPVGEKGQRIFTQKMRFTVMDGESGESFAFDMYGQGADSMDKGAFKSTTGAVKYALLKLFLIPTGDDPERDRPRNATASPPSGANGLRTKVLKKPTPPSAPNITAAAQSAASSIRAGHDRSLVYPFGNCKGQPISSPKVDDNSIAFWLNRLLQENADPSKSKWHAKNSQTIATLQAEQRYRLAQQAAETGAPVPYSSDGADEPPPPGDEDAPF